MAKLIKVTMMTMKCSRMNEMPQVDVHIIKNNEEPGGVGEPGLPPIAPAFINAVFAATGKRIRKLPITPKNFKNLSGQKFLMNKV